MIYTVSGLYEISCLIIISFLFKADLNLVGFIPEEIKWLTSLESFDLQNNHLVSLSFVVV